LVAEEGKWSEECPARMIVSTRPGGAAAGT